jgi:Bacteriophage Gp15 protein.
VWPSDFKRKKTSSSNEIVYDVEFDKNLIEQSIAKQYHILPSEQAELKYADWAQMLSGIMDDTPLGRIVSIRQEKDPNVIKRYGAYEKKIRSDWQRFKHSKAKQDRKSKNAVQGDVKALQSVLNSMFGTKSKREN